MAQVRAAALTNYFEVARFVGLDPNAMLKRARINPAMLSDPDRRISRTAVNFLLTESAREANCVSFGLMMAESRELAHLGAIGLVLRHQQTVRGVVQAMARYQHLMGDTVNVRMEERGEDVAFIVGIAPGHGTVERQGIELVMGIVYRAIIAVSGGQWRPKAVHFTHPAPGDPAVHNRVFNVPLVFSSDFNGFVSSAAALDAPYSSADTELARYAESYLDLLAPGAAAASMEAQVRRSLDLMLPLGRATLEQVSENLGMPSRTLQRLLEKEGHSFGSLLHDVRREVAIDQLTHSSRSLGEIARMIGYATPSSFTRWFYGEFGLTPGSWRAGLRPAEADRPGLPPHPARTSRGARSAA
ncbi:AraC family transcriptional regulator [Sphingomonas sp. LB-2]|uniref:AraC family transcriptional regulator n=1 Tax=Sphingomonas caeni TaxID=2984949 RepID=UPI0022319ABE|nr:AraC family transcriptional regulator [Sphingomonas caeni]MCW3848781.1 AraC family transcriptional regulator [Sphingomonas caeni]